MKTHIRTVALGLLLFNALGAIYGGMMLIIDSTGNGIQLEHDLLEYTPFQSYLIPGIILFLSNGLLSSVAAILTVQKHRLYPAFILYQGIILCIWLTVQVKMIPVINTLHYIMAAVGILLIICGWLLGGLAAPKKAQGNR